MRQLKIGRLPLSGATNGKATIGVASETACAASGVSMSARSVTGSCINAEHASQRAPVAENRADIISLWMPGFCLKKRCNTSVSLYSQIQPHLPRLVRLALQRRGDIFDPGKVAAPEKASDRACWFVPESCRMGEK